MRWALACALTCGLSGCRHKPVLPPLPPITQPMALLSSPEPATPPMIEPPEVDLPPMPVATGSSPRRERRRRPSAPTTTSAAQPTPPAETPAVTVSPEEAAIGALSLGGEANPRAQQEAVELLNSIEGRLRSLPAQKLNMEKTQISRIRNFQKQAQQALDTGDTEGAMTLATKAKLLLDDLEK
ncbi:hypothetical protein BDD14_4980 [Edaphobacter modestus]|uniref:Uncharacterized protein n=2 Tax=Edaphobacter modestus TaxID=388466 RepID=A0A4Q7YZA5_9BACT|nr:hypothetical protein BDD14_4980 [Edaphobacter modestus]